MRVINIPSRTLKVLLLKQKQTNVFLFVVIEVILFSYFKKTNVSLNNKKYEKLVKVKYIFDMMINLKSEKTPDLSGTNKSTIFYDQRRNV